MTTETTQKHSKFTKGAIIAAIVVVLNLFFNYAISLAYPQPQYDDFIRPAQVVTPITTQAECVNVGGQWTENSMYNPKAAPVLNGDTSIATAGYCNPDYTNQQNYEKAIKEHNRTVFIILVILSIIALAVGAVASNEIISSAFSWGGVLSLIIASVRYWTDANNILKVVILAVALGVLIWIAIKKFGK